MQGPVLYQALLEDSATWHSQVYSATGYNLKGRLSSKMILRIPELKNEKFYGCENSFFIYIQNRNLHFVGYAAYTTS